MMLHLAFLLSHLLLFYCIIFAVDTTTSITDKELINKQRQLKTTKLQRYELFQDFLTKSPSFTSEGESLDFPYTTEKPLQHYVHLMLPVTISNDVPEIEEKPTSSPILSKNVSHYSILDAEILLSLKEYERVTQTYNHLQQQSSLFSCEIYGFYHVSSRKQFWKEVIEEQLLLLDGRRKFPIKQQVEENVFHYSHYQWDMKRYYSSLLSLTKGLYINVALEKMEEFYEIRDFIRSLPLRHQHKIIIGYNMTVPRYVFDDNHKEERAKIEREGNHSTGEFGSIMMMHGFCRHFQHQQDQLLFQSTSSEGGGVGGGSTVYSDSYETFDDERQYTPQHFMNRLNRYGGAGMFDSIKDTPTTSPDEPTTSNTKKNKKKSGKIKKALVYYIHNKGACCRKEKNNLHEINPIASWREMMNTFNIEFPSICMRAVGMKKYATCGTEYQDAHYSGNFWWSDCEHVSQLPALAHPLSWGEPEFFVGQFSDHLHKRQKYFYHCAYSAFRSDGDLYSRECPRQQYFQRLWESVMNNKLPPSQGLVPVNMTVKAKILKYCKAIRNPLMYEALIKPMPNSDTLLQKYNIRDRNNNRNPFKRRGYFGFDEVIEYYGSMENPIPSSL